MSSNSEIDIETIEVNDTSKAKRRWKKRRILSLYRSKPQQRRNVANRKRKIDLQSTEKRSNNKKPKNCHESNNIEDTQDKSNVNTAIVKVSTEQYSSLPHHNQINNKCIIHGCTQDMHKSELKEDLEVTIDYCNEDNTDLLQSSQFISSTTHSSAKEQPCLETCNFNYSYQSSNQQLLHDEPSADANTYKDECMHIVSTSGYMEEIIHKFNENGLLRHFMAFLDGIHNGKLSCLNMAVQTCLEMAMLKSLDNTVAMRYRMDTKMLWEAVLKIGGPKTLRLFSSDKHFGQVLTGDSEKSKYSPDTGNFNFAVPDESTLRKSTTNIPNKVECGIIESAIQMLDPTKQYIVQLDGKYVAPGCRGETEGDINLWGYETAPTLKENVDRYKEEMLLQKTIKANIELDTSIIGSEMEELLTVLYQVSMRVKELRDAKVKHEILRETYNSKIKRNPSLKDNYIMGFSEIEAFHIGSDSTIDKLLAENDSLLETMSNLNLSDGYFNPQEEIDLQHQSNYMILLEPCVIDDESFLIQNTEFIKQGSQLWLDVRKNFRISGSTLHDALGLKSLQSMNNHIDTFVHQKFEKKFDAETQKAIDHGSANEKHAVATITSKIIPALFPPCYKFREIGSYRISTDECENFMIISPDGIIECTETSPGHRCEARINLIPGPIAVEIKCPYFRAKSTRCTPVHYEPPQYYTCQVNSEMFVLKCKHLLFVSWTRLSTSCMLLDFSEMLWKKIWDLGILLYNQTSICKKSRLLPQTKELRSLVKEYASTNSKFVLEVSSSLAKDTPRKDTTADDNWPCYRKVQLVNSNNTPTDKQDAEYINMYTIATLQRLLLLAPDVFNLLRRKATEVLLIVASDIDRLFDKDHPNCIPIAYAMKGKSVKTQVIRSMMQDVRSKLMEHNITVRAECMDGQWANLVFRSKENKPLTVFELQRDTWNSVSKLSKEKLLMKFNNWSKVDALDQQNLGNLQFQCTCNVSIGNITLAISNTNPLMISIGSNCGELNFQDPWNFVDFPFKKNRPECWHITECQSDSIIHKLGLDNYDANIEDFTGEEDGNYYQRSRNVNDISNSQGEKVSDQTTVRLPVTEQEFVKKVLFDNKRELLEHILIALLTESKGDKWKSLDLDEFYNTVFESGQSVMMNLTCSQIELVVKIMNSYFALKDRIAFNCKDNKLDKCNKLCNLLRLREAESKVRRTLQMKSLAELCKIRIKYDVPAIVLRVTAAQVMFECRFQQWLKDATVPMVLPVPTDDGEFNCFSYPERCASSQQLLNRIIDPSHCLTNLRVHATQKGFFGCDPKSFIRVSDNNSNLLNKGILIDMLDKQSVPIALRVFSARVEENMLMNNDVREAEMVRTIRQWYNACNERGLKVSQRIQYLNNMHEYLLDKYNVGYFPMKTTHVQGLPNITYQSIMLNCSTRLQLYGQIPDHKYCQRAVSTLDVEGQFSILSGLAKYNNGCPLAADVPWHISRMSQTNSIRSNPNKNFDMKLTKKSTYPAYTLDLPTDVVMQDASGNVLYRSHEFDKPEKYKRVKKWRKDNVTFGNAPLSGVVSVRTMYHRINESKIPAMRRMGYM